MSDCNLGRGLLVKRTAHVIEISACACHCWSCEKCGPIRQWRCEQEIIAGEPTTFITLGCRTGNYDTPEEARAHMGQAMPKLAKRIRRRWPAHEFEYAVYVEAFKKGYPHFHIACRAPYIPQKWLSKQWKALIDAPVVHLRTAGTARQIAKYLCKYLVKQPHQFGKAKRYWYSQNYRPMPVLDRRRSSEKADFYWRNNTLQQQVAIEMHEGAFPIVQTADRVLLDRSFEQ